MEFYHQGRRQLQPLVRRPAPPAAWISGVSDLETAAAFCKFDLPQALGWAHVADRPGRDPCGLRRRICPVGVVPSLSARRLAAAISVQLATAPPGSARENAAP